MEVYRFQWTGAAWNIMSWLRLYPGSLYILLNLPCNCHLCIYWNTWYFSKFQCSLISPWRENSVLHKVFCSGRNLLYCLGFFSTCLLCNFQKSNPEIECSAGIRAVPPAHIASQERSNLHKNNLYLLVFAIHSFLSLNHHG